MMNRLLNRVKRLEESKGGNRGVVCITIDEGESVDEAKERHFVKHPEDREGRIFLIVAGRDPTQGISAD